MNVQLIDYTGAGFPDPARRAAEVLIFTKSTRLEMNPSLMESIQSMPWKDIERELEYMANTIPSSWEFINYTFLISDVTRAFTHQLVRTRAGSYAQQTMRVLNVEGWRYATGPTIAADEHQKRQYDIAMDRIADAYDGLIEDGAAIEDARGVLPTNILTNIVAKFDLRTLADTMRKRASPRTQGEYRSVIEGMRAEVVRVHPWASMFIDRTFDRAAAELDTALIRLKDEGKISEKYVTDLIKLIDQMRVTA